MSILPLFLTVEAYAKVMFFARDQRSYGRKLDWIFL